MSMNDVIAYRVEWFDSNANAAIALRLNLFTDNTVELLGAQDRKTFLKRIEYPDLRREDLFIGNTISIFNRVYTVVDHADEAARLAQADTVWHFLCVVDGTDVNQAHQLFAAAQQHGLSVGRTMLAQSVACPLPEIPPSTRPRLLMEVVAMSANPRLGAFERALESTFQGAQVVTASPAEIEQVFSSCTAPQVSEACTLCLVKPHILRENRTAALLRSIAERGFDMAGLQKFHLNGSMAESFFGVYKGIIPNYAGHLAQACSGPSIALMLVKGADLQDREEHVAQLFREACGPFDSEVARILRPQSIRAQFSQDRVRNAVHCTDIPEDGALECSYFFDVLAGL